MTTRKQTTGQTPKKGRRQPLAFELLERRDVPSGNLATTSAWNTLQLADFGGDKINEVVVRGPDGVWHIGPSASQEAQFGSLRAFTNLNLVVGDYNGDGKSDVAALGANGVWQVGLSQGGLFPIGSWGQWANPRTWTTLLAGDLTGSGRDDILALNADGSLELARSTGSSFQSYYLGQIATPSHWAYLGLADVDGTGTKELVGFSNDGTWWVGRLNTSTMTMNMEAWAQWSPAANWSQVFVGDFTGAGRADIAGFNKDGSWYVGVSRQYPVQDPFNNAPGLVSEFVTSKWGQWSAASNWQHVFAGDFNDNGRTDVAGLALDGNWWLGTSTGTSFSTALWGSWDPTVAFSKIAVGNWDGAASAELLGFSSDGQWWLGEPGPVPVAAALAQGVAPASFGLATQTYADWPDYTAPSQTITPWTDDTFWKNAVAGNFGGDGRSSYFGFTSDGGAWIATPNNQVLFHSAGLNWPANHAYSTIVTGDFNGDGKTDVAAFSVTGEWVIGIQTGPFQFKITQGAVWSPASTWEKVFAGDVNGDGRTDLIGFNNDGSWWVAFAQANGTFVTNKLAQWSVAADWRFVGIGDFKGDGKTDIIGFNNDGTWWLGYSNGLAFQTEALTRWLPSAHWLQIGLGDFNADGIPDIYGVSTDGSWWVGSNSRQGYTQGRWLRWLPLAGLQTVRSGDFNGDSRADFLAIDNAGTWWVGLSTGKGFQVTPWYQWAAGTRVDTLLLGDFTGSGATGFWAFDTAGADTILQGLSTGGMFATKTITTDEAPPWAPGAPWATSVNQVLFDNLPVSQLQQLYFNNATTYQDYAANYQGVLRGWVAQADSLGVADADLPAFIQAKMDALFPLVENDLASFYPGLTSDKYRLFMIMNLVQGYYVYTTTSYTGGDLVVLLRLPQADCQQYAELFRQLASVDGFYALHASISANYFSPDANSLFQSVHAMVAVDGMLIDPLNNIALKVDLNQLRQVAPTDRLRYLFVNHDVYGFYNWNLKPEIRQVYVEQNLDPGIIVSFYYYFFEGLGRGVSFGIY